LLEGLILAAAEQVETPLHYSLSSNSHKLTAH
jgi:hypothetical protein